VPGLLTNFWASLGFLGVTLAGATGLAYLLFRTFTEKWLSQKFNERLEDYRHAQQKELEQLRLQINSTMDKTIKLNQFEFDVLPKLWSRLTAAFGEISHLVSPMQSLPDLDRMNAEHLREFLESSELAEWQKSELRGRSDKTMAYAKMSFWYEFNRVNKVYYEFNNDLIANGIFLSDDLKTKMKWIRQMMSDAMLEKRLDEEHDLLGPGRFEKEGILRKEGPPLLDEIEIDVQARLRETPLSVR
jgi:hypothetical protein